MFRWLFWDLFVSFSVYVCVCVCARFFHIHFLYTLFIFACALSCVNWMKYMQFIKKNYPLPNLKISLSWCCAFFFSCFAFQSTQWSPKYGKEVKRMKNDFVKNWKKYERTKESLWENGKEKISWKKLWQRRVDFSRLLIEFAWVCSALHSCIPNTNGLFHWCYPILIFFIVVIIAFVAKFFNVFVILLFNSLLK